MAARSARTPSKARRLGSYLVSLAVHGSVLLSLGPCLPTVPTAMRVQRLAPPGLDADSPRDPAGPADGALHDAETAQALPSDRPWDPSLDRADPPHTPADPLPDSAPESPHDRPPDSPHDRPPNRPRDTPQADLPEEPPEEPPDDVVHVVHTTAPGDRPDEAEAESAHDQDAVAAHAPVLALEEGPDRPERLESAAQRVAAGEPGSASRAAAGGASAHGPSAPTRGAAGAQAATGGDDIPMGPDPDWWHPIATRIPPATPRAQLDGERIRDRVEEPADGSVDGDEVPVVAETPPEEALDPLVEPSDAVADGTEGVDAGQGTVDAGEQDPAVAEAPDALTEAQDGVADARIDGQAQDGRDPTLESRLAPASSHQTVVDAVEGPQARVSALATERGAWIQEVDAVVRERWASRELPVHLQGIGLRGEATVQFVIQPNGRTSEPVLVRRSGNEWLDAYALDAIPPKVPKMPRTLEPVAVEHRITFRYR